MEAKYINRILSFQNIFYNILICNLINVYLKKLLISKKIELVIKKTILDVIQIFKVNFQARSCVLMLS